MSSNIILATSKDFKEIKALFDRANEYSATKIGEPVWVNIDYAYKQLDKEINAGNCFFIRNNENKMAAVICIGDEDEFAWGEEGKDNQALYFHKLMKDPAVTLPGAAKTLVKFAARQALDQGKKYLRCDTSYGATNLVKYYEQLGFIKKRVITYPSMTLEAVLLEADLMTII